ncbi:MAG: (Fe-S)-binding protein [Desulfurococcales archaeon]|nr:(Fe-S)-binding protein [Desulfurococcales archaeon]MEB3806035.1 (Fe-S)-binding protein [Desulfurococcales archaeon]
MQRDPREYILAEAGKCMFCGFCEALCPTLPLGPHRGYGPRGRVNLALAIARGEAGYTGEAINSLYTCLLCEACHLKCPASLDIVGVVRAARALYSRGL